MARSRILAVVVAAIVATGAAAQDNKKKADKPGGPFELPALDAVKDKCKPKDDQSAKLETIYKDAAAKEDQTRKTAKDSGSDKKDLDRFLLMGKTETINKIKEVLDKDQQAAFDQLMSADPNNQKKKKK